MRHQKINKALKLDFRRDLDVTENVTERLLNTAVFGLNDLAKNGIS